MSNFTFVVSNEPPDLRVQLEKISIIYNVINEDRTSYQYINYLSGKNSSLLPQQTPVITERIVFSVEYGRLVDWSLSTSIINKHI